MQLHTTLHFTQELTNVHNTTAIHWRHSTPTWRDLSTKTTLMLPSNCTRTIVCPGFVGPSDPHPRPTFGTSHRRMTGRDAGGPEDAVPLRPPDSGLTPPPVRGLHGLDTVGPGAYPTLSAQIPPARGLHGLDTVGPGVYQFPPKCSSESDVSRHFLRIAASADCTSTCSLGRT